MKFKFLLCFAPLLFLISCGGDFYMLKQDTGPEIKADPQKAVLVLYRGTSFGAAVTIDNFIDKAFVGQTRGKSYFITKVEPGSHYVIGKSENNSCAKVNFEAGKVYYLLQGIYPGVMFARTGFSGSSPEDFEKDHNDLTFYVSDSQKTPPVMEDEDYNQTTADYDKESKEDPEKHKDTENIKGY